MGMQIYFDNYSPVGDILVMAISLVIFVLLSASYVSKTKIYGIYVSIVVLTFAAAMTNLAYHSMYTRVTNGDYEIIYVMRAIYHAILFLILTLYVFYIAEGMRIEYGKKNIILVVAVLVYLGVIGTDIVTSLMGKGFRLNASGEAIRGQNIFMYGYLMFVTMIIILLIIFRKRIYNRVMLGFYGTMAVSFLVLYLQGRFSNTSFTVGTFLLPSIAMLYLIHSNPYDVEMGSIDAKGLEEMIKYYYEKGSAMILMSLFLPDFEANGNLFSKEMQDTIRRFSSEYVKNGVLFRVSSGHIILVALKDKNMDYKQKMKAMLDAFYPVYEKFRYDYKIVAGECIEEISRRNEYVRFIKSIHQNMKMNEVHVIKEKDVKEFDEYEYIVEELSDICKSGNLDDKRVLAYCQPVYNLSTGKYDTAEALMRLDLAQKGIIYPSKFIPIAEENGFIHGLTKIILHKTCDEIGKMIREGYEVQRVSVNVSITEMHDLSFTEDVFSIIRDSNVPDEKIAIEITESQTEHDFVVVKDKINELRERGIRIYLDDFGTGYSNMERILELPFDIIKFDRSLVIAAEGNDRSEKLVGSLANMFTELNYSVLYEGVETDGDERRCTGMFASYLQGYKYSRPIPIAQLRDFFTKRVWK